MKKQFWGFFALLIGVSFFACRKHDVSDSGKTIKPASEKEIATIKQWLSIQKNSDSKKDVDKLVEALNWSSTDKTSYKSTSTLITIKLSTKATARKVAKYIVGANDHTTDYLVVLMDSMGKILQGTIGQVTPHQSQDNSPPSELVANILNKKGTQFNGAFTMLTLSNDFLYQFQYENQKRTKEIVVQNVNKEIQAKIKTNSIKASSAKMLLNEIKKDEEEVCWTWYLFIFDDYGNILDAIFLGIECVTPCALATIRNDGELGVVRVNCYSGGGGGGGFNLEDLCNATSSQARAVFSNVTYESLNESTMDLSPEEPAPTDDYPQAVKRPVTPKWKFERVYVTLLYPTTFGAVFNGVVKKNSESDPWQWESLSFGSIMKISGSPPPCFGVSWTSSSSIALSGADAHVQLTYQYSFTITCPVTTEYASSGVKTKSKTFSL
jgi:hypothetical protein